MSSALYALGRWAFRARRLVLALWVIVLVVLIAGAGLLGKGTDNTYTIPGTESQSALDALARTFPQVSGTSAQLIAVAPRGASVKDAGFQKAVEDSAAAIAKIPQVSSATSPYAGTAKGNVNPDASAALMPIQLSVVQSAVFPATKEGLQEAGRKLAAELPAGSRVAVGGQLYSQSPAGIGVTDLIGIVVALIVLIFAFASVVAAGFPLITAICGVGASLSVILIATRFATITSTTPLLSLMLGLAVGIDYALFIISRHQDQLKQGLAPEESVARAVATAGSAVVFAAITVIIALLGLGVARIPFLTTMGIAAALAVAIAVLVSLTLIPALLGFAGRRVVAKRFRAPADGAGSAPVREMPGAGDGARPERTDDDGASPPHDGADSPHDGESSAGTGDAASRAGDGAGSAVAGDAVPGDAAAGQAERTEGTGEPPPLKGFFYGWVRAVTRVPVLTILVIVALLGLATLPAAHLRLALPDAGSLEEHEPGRIAYDLIAEHFGPGYNGPLIVTGSTIQSTDPVGLMNDIGADIAKLPGVAAVPLSTPNEAGDTGIVQVIPEGSPDSTQTQALVAELRSMHGTFEEKYGVDLSVTGYTAAGIDISARLGGAIVPFGLLVVGLSLVLLAMVFRSVVVPITAALGYLLSIGAAFGISSLVFENGFLAGPLNVTGLGSVISFMPIILMGVLFGLAMDYEVFLVSRMREDYVHGGSARHAIHSGFVGSGRVVTAAAIIMFSVFAAFVPSGDTSIQPIALGLAVGVAIDAFVVRMSLIPAILMLFGDKAWWMPRWLDRALPAFDVEGQGLQKELAVADWPEPGAGIAIAAEGVSVAAGGRTVVEGFDARIPAGEALVIAGGPGSGKSALMYALAARAPIAGGRLKVAGLALPMRTAGVRSTVGVVRFSGSPDPVADLRLALAAEPAVIVIDDIDAVRLHALRAQVSEVLAGAWEEAGARGATLTVAASRGEPEGASVAGLLPPAITVYTVRLVTTSPEPLEMVVN